MQIIANFSIFYASEVVQHELKFRFRLLVRTRSAGVRDLACSLTSTRDVVSAGRTRSHSPTTKIAAHETTSNMLKLECNCSPVYKIAKLHSNSIYQMSKHPKTSAACIPTSSILQPTHAYKTDRRLNSAATQHKIPTVSAQLFGCYSVRVASERSPITKIRPPSGLPCHTSRLPLNVTQKYSTPHKGAIVEIHDCSKLHAFEMRRMSYFSSLGHLAASLASRTTTRVVVAAGPEGLTPCKFPTNRDFLNNSPTSIPIKICIQTIRI